MNSTVSFTLLRRCTQCSNPYLILPKKFTCGFKSSQTTFDGMIHQIFRFLSSLFSTHSPLVPKKIYHSIIVLLEINRPAEQIQDIPLFALSVGTIIQKTSPEASVVAVTETGIHYRSPSLHTITIDSDCCANPNANTPETLSASHPNATIPKAGMLCALIRQLLIKPLYLKHLPIQSIPLEFEGNATL